MLYKSLARRHPNQDLTETFAFFPFEKVSGENWETPFDKLVGLAKKEDWDFHRPEFKKPGIKHPILHSYLNYTFLRLQEEKKILEDGTTSCFNTGLITADEKEIFALFSKNTRHGSSAWVCKGFFDSYSKELSRFRSSLPKTAKFIHNSSDLVLDLDYDIEVNVGHILDDPENQDRLPELLRNNRNIALSAIEGATKFLKLKVERNYKTAIPQYYAPEKRIQLLLPLCIVSPEKADLALVADKDPVGNVYRIRTALRMDMAFSNARLITRPDREWLDP